jgi:hypothetical protein
VDGSLGFVFYSKVIWAAQGSKLSYTGARKRVSKQCLILPNLEGSGEMTCHGLEHKNLLLRLNVINDAEFVVCKQESGWAELEEIAGSTINDTINKETSNEVAS